MCAGDAVCNEDTYEVTDGSDGYGFDIKKAMDELEKAGPGGEVTLTLDVIEPQYTKESLQEKLFHDELASYDSPYNAGLIGRSENLRLACLAINGYVLKPGETFSFNGVVGERTAAKGYKEGGVYVGGRDRPAARRRRLPGRVRAVLLHAEIRPRGHRAAGAPVCAGLYSLGHGRHDLLGQPRL